MNVKDLFCFTTTMKYYQFKMPYLQETWRSHCYFYFFRIEFHFVEKFVFLYYSNSPLQIEHNYIQSLCFTLNLWYWMSHFYSTKYFYTAHKCQEVKSWWHFKYIWKNYFFLELYVFFLTKKNKTCFWNEKKRFHNM